MTQDFIVGKDGYEGGEEVWECSQDLVDYIRQAGNDITRSLCSDQDGEPLRILELGCGHAKPSWALVSELDKLGVLWTLTLQDLDAPSLEKARETFAQYRNLDRVQFVEGEWSQLGDTQLASTPYDIVLMSETLYRASIFPVLSRLLRQVLAPQSGLCLSAQKRFYFGLDGGSLPFLLYTKENGCGLSCRLVKDLQDGRSNIRDIMAITSASTSP
ncbi:putative methyltransferase [Gregarina niphandrodes]|uniref:protein-histidine N-methyltransferase n=1 Tax=Gregarina niphandrodes TaxID=110365 RepID=A0A023BBH3_GRENI|nr:putative methyltransferase [Gregarina niphandrodes]EZG79729.1 putative methyltransferase [Gregarina niphandrodes]|eukprot:XP_011134385.1 putative methyltransferase [Gregarina niphandrodes]